MQTFSKLSNADCDFWQNCSRIATGGVSEQQLAGFHDQNGTNFKDAATAGGFPAKNYKVRYMPGGISSLTIRSPLNNRQDLHKSQTFM